MEYFVMRAPTSQNLDASASTNPQTSTLSESRRTMLALGLNVGAGLLAASALAGLSTLSGCAKGRRRFTPLASTEATVQARASELDPNRPSVNGGYARRAPARGEGMTSIPTSMPVMARGQWADQGVNVALANPMTGIHRITVHHDAIHSSGLYDQGDAIRRLQTIRKSHVNQQWADIGYHYIIDPQGRIWEGRPIRFQGAHVKNNNEGNLGIMVMGNFDDEMPTGAALASLDAFIADRMRAYRVPTNRVFTHQEINSTACPGRNLQAYMRQTRSGAGRLSRTV
jgi:N-acetylmuramoyl-L-alanine amidase